MVLNVLFQLTIIVKSIHQVTDIFFPFSWSVVSHLLKCQEKFKNQMYRQEGHSWLFTPHWKEYERTLFVMKFYFCPFVKRDKWRKQEDPDINLEMGLIYMCSYIYINKNKIHMYLLNT